MSLLPQNVYIWDGGKSPRNGTVERNNFSTQMGKERQQYPIFGGL
jgi:hypothetical protein